MEIDAVALEAGGVAQRCGFNGGVRGLAGTKHKHDPEHCAQTDNGQCP